MFFIKNQITTNQSKLQKIKELKTKILKGATGFEVLYETEVEYQLTYLFDKIEISILKDLGTHSIIDKDMESFGQEILKTINNEIQDIEQDIKYLQFKLQKFLSNESS